MVVQHGNILTCEQATLRDCTGRVISTGDTVAVSGRGGRMRVDEVTGLAAYPHGRHTVWLKTAGQTTADRVVVLTA